MLLRRLFLILSFLVAAALHAAEPSAKPAKSEEPETPLTAQMEAMNKSWRTIRRQVGDAGKTAETLGLVVEMKAHLAKATDFDPAMAAELPADKRAAFVADYHRDLGHLVAAVDQLEAALKAGDNAQATDIVQKMNDMRRDGHKRYKSDDK